MGRVINKNKDLSDLVLEYQETRDEELIEEVLDKSNDYFLNLSASILLRNKVDPVLFEDATQEVKAQIFQKIDHYDGSCKFETWAYRVAKNCILKYLGYFIKQIPISVWQEMCVPEIKQKEREIRPILKEKVEFYGKVRNHSLEFISTMEDERQYEFLTDNLYTYEDMMADIHRKQKNNNFYFKLPMQLKELFVDYFIFNVDSSEISKKYGLSSSAVNYYIQDLKVLANIYLVEEIDYFDEEIFKRILKNTYIIPATTISDFGNLFNNGFYMPKTHIGHNFSKYDIGKFNKDNFLKKTGYKITSLISGRKLNSKKTEIYKFDNQDKYHEFIGLTIMEKYYISKFITSCPIKVGNQIIPVRKFKEDGGVVMRLNDRFFPLQFSVKKRYNLKDVSNLLDIRKSHVADYLKKHNIEIINEVPGNPYRGRYISKESYSKLVGEVNNGEMFFGVNDVIKIVFDKYNKETEIKTKSFIMEKCNQYFIELGQIRKYIPARNLPLIVYHVAENKDKLFVEGEILKDEKEIILAS
ncbi:sigma-70 family RNA polymerase sigma factor [Nanoarchaeota archaeon]